MFENDDAPRIFQVPLGEDFGRSVITGLRARLAEHPPEALGRVEIIVHAQRLKSVLKEHFLDGFPGFMPKISTLADLQTEWKWRISRRPIGC